MGQTCNADDGNNKFKLKFCEETALILEDGEWGGRAVQSMSGDSNVRVGVDGTGSVSCPVAGFDIMDFKHTELAGI